MSVDPDDILSPSTVILLPASVVATRIAPHMPGTDASAWLKDLRRSNPKYRRRVSRPPRAVRRGCRVFYPLQELHRLLDELRADASAPETDKGASA